MKRKKYSVIKLTKEVQYLYTKNYKTFRKESKKDLNKWKDICCLWIGRHYSARNTPQTDIQVPSNPYKNSSCLSKKEMTK